MSLCSKKDLQDQVALGSALEPGFLYVFEKDFLLFGHTSQVCVHSNEASVNGHSNIVKARWKEEGF
jgi:hypothetical protein